MFMAKKSEFGALQEHFCAWEVFLTFVSWSQLTCTNAAPRLEYFGPVSLRFYLFATVLFGFDWCVIMLMSMPCSYTPISTFSPWAWPLTWVLGFGLGIQVLVLGPVLGLDPPVLVPHFGLNRWVLVNITAVCYTVCLKTCSYRLVLCTHQPSRDLARLLLLDRYPSLESFVTISLELLLWSKTRHYSNKSIFLQYDDYMA